MRPLCSLSLVCTEYLMDKINTNGVKLEYYIHIINLNKYFYGNPELTPFGCHFLLRITGFRAFESGCSSLKCFFRILCRRIVAGCTGQYVLCSEYFMNGFSTMFSINSVTRGWPFNEICCMVFEHMQDWCYGFLWPVFATVNH